ncbi:MAG: Panacea domain-containing protein [Tannerellaceae bacterium]
MTTPIFNLEKSLQVVLYIANKLQRKDFHKIFKIIYFADREHIAQYGRPITGDTYIAMKDGPVPSNIDDIFKAVRGDGFFASNAVEYAKLFEIHDWYFVKPKQAANLDYLSESDLEELDKALALYGNLSWDEVRDKSHDYAWHSTPKDRPIALEDIMREKGEDDDYIAYICNATTLQKACL